MSSKKERIELIDSGSYLASHSMSQKVLANDRERINKFFGNSTSKKVVRANERRTIDENFRRSFLQVQFQRSLGHWIKDEATEEDLSHIFKQISRFERYLVSDGPIQITMVELISEESQGNRSGNQVVV